MARAYQEMVIDAVPQVTTRECTACETWDDETEWRSYSVWVYGEDERYEIYDDEESYVFGRASEEQKAYVHQPCGNWFINASTDTTGSAEIWVCGECGYRTHDKERARNCCT